MDWVNILFRLSGCNLSERSCEALFSFLISQSSSLRELDLSNNELQVFDLKKYSASEEALLRLLPVVKASNKALYMHTQLSRLNGVYIKYTFFVIVLLIPLQAEWL